ncbi:MAG: hypothetical protein JWR63_1678 [Conexibacter sp.]|nr:hypothetical protein [Conexibacter sp.]
MSRLRLRHLRLRVSTDKGSFGADVGLAPGLNVLEAANSRGKSICTQSILYVLGMEAMLGSRHDVPLPDAMNKELLTPGGEIARVHEARVWLEIEGEAGQIVTVARWAKHGTIDRKLVSVWDGPVLTEGGVFEQHDHLVRAEGVLGREVGFHHFLANLVGWNPPVILRNDGRESALYLEYLFPLMFVEQRGGWSGIQAQQPNFFLPDAKKRAVEYIVGISAYERERAHLQLRQRRASLDQAWRAAVGEIRGRAQTVGMVLTGIGNDLLLTWPPENEPALIAIATKATLTSEIGRLHEEVEMAQRVIERPETTDETIASTELDEYERDLVVLSAATAGLADQANQEEETQRAVGRTLTALKADLERNVDARRIRDLGSESWAQPEHECPTCHQTVEDVLLSVGDKPQMSLDDNIAYIKAEIETFTLLRNDAGHVYELRQRNLEEHRGQLRDLRLKIRAARTAAVAGKGTPSAAAIQAMLQARARLDDLQNLEGVFVELLDRLSDLSKAATDLEAQLSGSASFVLTVEESQRLDSLRRLVVDQLQQYGFDSFSPTQIEISNSSFQPARNDAAIGFGISASDGIRLIWAFLIGLLELDRGHPTNHLGVVIFDEPRQQSANRPSLDAFLARASTAGAHQQQVLLATSEDPEILTASLAELPHKLIHIPDRLLQPIS